MKLEKTGTDQFTVLLKFDSRCTKQNMRLGSLDEAELKAHINSLPDSTANLDYAKIEDIHANN